MTLEQKNPELQKLIHELKKASIEQKAPIWKSLALELEKPARNRRIINLSKISLYANDGETVVVAGKVLGGGVLDKKKLSIAAYSFSQDAVEKIKNSESNTMDIYELIKKNPKGQKVKVLG